MQLFLQKTFPGGPVVKNSLANEEDVGLIPGSGRPPREGKDNHSSMPVWEIPWTEAPAGYSPWGRKCKTQLSN